jgi:hypothetical protein
MLQRKGKLKGKTKDTRLALFCIFAQILVYFVCGLFARRINFKKSLHFTKSSFTRKLLCKEHQSKHHAVRLSSSSLTSQKICDIVLVALEYRCLSRFSRSRRGRLGTLTHDGQNALFFSVAFPLPLLFPRRISLTSLSLSLSLYVITVKSSTYKPDSAVTKSGRSSGRYAFRESNNFVPFFPSTMMMNTIFHFSLFPLGERFEKDETNCVTLNTLSFFLPTTTESKNNRSSAMNTASILPARTPAIRIYSSNE